MPSYSGDVICQPALNAPTDSLDSFGLYDSLLAAVVTAFTAHCVVDVPCAAVGAESDCGGNSLVVCATLRCTCL